MTNTIRLSTKDYTRRESGELVSYRGDLGVRAIRYSRELSFWPWGRSDGSLATGQIEIDNRDGRYDQLVFRDLRDQDVQVKLPTIEGTDIIAVTAIVDSTEAPDDQTVRVSLKDTLTLLDVPLQTEVFGDDADGPVEGRVLPLTLGVARTIRPPLWEAFPATTGPAYRLHDSSLSGITNVRDKGIVLNPLLSPAQYALDARIGNAGITLDVEPVGVVTVDASTSGDLQLPVSPTDVLGGIGAFNVPFPTVTTTNSTEITGWTFFGTNPSATEAFQEPNFSYNPTQQSGRLAGGFTQTGRAFMTTDSRLLEAGKTYRWRIRMPVPVSHATLVNGAIASTGAFCLRAMISASTADQVTPAASDGVNLFVRRTFDANNIAGTYTGTYTVPGTTDRFFQLASLNGGLGHASDVEFIEVPPPPPDELEGITLKNYSLEVIRRAGLPDGQLVDTTIDAIDPDNAQIGLYLDSPITALGVMRAPLDSYCADVYSDREGRYRFAQLRDPSEELPSLLINSSRLASPPQVSLDRAEGLTTSIVARRNHYRYSESDFADNPSEIPLTLREQLSAAGQFTRSAALPEAGLPTIYRHGIEADPLISVFDLAADALTQIQRVVDLYAVLRFRVDCDIWLEPGEFVDLNSIAELKYPRFGLDAGKQFLVYGVTDEVTDRARRRICRLRLWG